MKLIKLPKVRNIKLDKAIKLYEKTKSQNERRELIAVFLSA